MPVNQGLSHLSDHFLLVTVVLYSLAVLAFAADFAFGRRARAASRPQARGAGAGHRGRRPAAAAGSSQAGRGRRQRRERPAARGTPVLRNGGTGRRRRSAGR